MREFEIICNNEIIYTGKSEDPLLEFYNLKLKVFGHLDSKWRQDNILLRSAIKNLYNSGEEISIRILKQ